MSIGLVVPAAGVGSRLGHARPKALADLGGEALLRRTLGRFVGVADIVHVVIAAPYGLVAEVRVAAAGLEWSSCGVDVIEGGSSRQDSVRRSLEALRPGIQTVLVHDAARPLISRQTIVAVLDAARRTGAATAATRSSDSVRKDSSDGWTEIVDRSQVWLVETPQAFAFELLCSAHRDAAAAGMSATDDAALIERCGAGRVAMVQRVGLNFKVTTQEDLRMAALLIDRGAEI